ncbi:MAG: haloacid dehalogenase type II [Actinomycetota bacterium]|nr:haloacid dehalogenase type II [Actinomycetota bacterium]
MARVCVFDVNETLLDLAALDPLFERAFGDAGVRRSWFQQVLQSAFLATITGAYSDFGAIGAAALEMTAEREGVRLSEEDRRSILGGMRELPPHPEVPAALDLLRDAGLRLAALTNNTAEVAEAQLQNAGISDRFERILSADTVRRLKPAPEPYRAAAEALGVEAPQVRLVAAHAWDVAGALRAGCAAAFVARPGMVLEPLVGPPDVVGADLSEVALSIIAAEA